MLLANVTGFVRLVAIATGLKCGNVTTPEYL